MATRERRDLPEGFHDRSRIEQVRLDQLRVDRSYQRDPSQILVDKITGNWDEVASELILVSDRGERDPASGVDGGLFLVNGQHRSLAARKLNMETVWARIVDLSEEPDPAATEAGLRLKTNVKLGDRPTERFKAQLRAGDPDSLAIRDMLEKFDTQINLVPNPEGGINAVSTVEKIHKADLLYDTLALLKDAYGHLGGRNVSAGMMQAAAWFIGKHAFETDRYRIVEKLKLTGTESLYRRAVTYQSTMGGSVWMNYYRVFVELYNEKLADRNRIEVRLRGAGTFGGVSDSEEKATVIWR